MHSFRPLHKTILAALFCLVSSVKAVDPDSLPIGGINAHWADFSHISTSLPFTNALQTASEWYASDGQELTLDENNYPTSLAEEQMAFSLVFGENSHIPTGLDQSYTLVWEGSGVLQLSYIGGEYYYDRSSTKRQELTFPATAAQDSVTLAIRETDPEDPIRNVRLYLPGYDESSGTWTNHFVDYVREFGLLRFCWGVGVNVDSSREIVEWSDRRSPSEYTFGNDIALGETNGVAYEAMIELANQAEVDLWVCVPHLTSESYRTQMAQLFRDGLDEGNRLWVEYSNEIFNSWFPVHQDLYQESLTLNEPLPEEEQIDLFILHGRKAAELFTVFDSVFSASGQRDQLVTVFSGQNGFAYPLAAGAQEIERIGSMDLVDVFSIAPYFAIPEPDDHEDPLRPVLEGQDPTALDPRDRVWAQAFVALKQLVDFNFEQQYIAGLQNEENRQVAETYGKPIVAYEGGQHLHTFEDESGRLAYLGRWISPINQHEGVRHTYDYFLRSWDEWGGRTMVFYSAYFYPNEEEAFGLKTDWRQPSEEAPKYLAARDWLMRRKALNTGNDLESAEPSMQARLVDEKVHFQFSVPHATESPDVGGAFSSDLSQWDTPGFLFVDETNEVETLYHAEPVANSENAYFRVEVAPGSVE
ncbi:hypothetical protein [Pelagicoccus albus]|uniref:Uncharacterized protein n=1 Tax=Pelagicoccus albus TaxID=415222 RepID=A0A7X1B6Q5_9BACT|nr:hypothetical protein [Pelagicoccus albus]MBC2606671.1 hypothetical protein [Pelagicoccus albus]